MPREANPEAILSQREAHQALARLIRALPPEMRDVLILRDVDGLSTAETAVKRGIKEGLVKWRLNRTRNRYARN